MLDRLCGAALIGGWIALALPTGALADTEREAVHRLGTLDVLGDTPNYLEIGLGAFDVFSGRDGDGQRSAAGQLQLRIGRKLWFAGPLLGLMANTDGGVYGYGGIYADLAYGNVVLTPVFGLGGYQRGSSKNLGGVFQFRGEVGVAYEFGGGQRIGARLTHISNGNIHDDNPGEEELLVTFALPF